MNRSLKKSEKRTTLKKKAKPERRDKDKRDLKGEVIENRR